MPLRKLWLGAVAGCGLIACASPAEAQNASAGAGPIQLTVHVQETLARLQDQWLLWNSAFLQGDQQLAEHAVRDLLATTDELGMSGLPDLNLGILVRAVEAGREGDLTRARWALAMAEQLDPNRPETAFARSRVAALDGNYLEALGYHVLGYARLVRQALERMLFTHNLLLWAVAVLMLSGGLYVALQLATRGEGLYQDLATALSRMLPEFAAYVLAVVALAWPLLLPHGWLWLVLYWAALLWTFGSVSERIVIAAICVIYGFAPIAVLRQQTGLGVALSEPMRAVNNLAEGRLYGSVFRDLTMLSATLPESGAVSHLIADLYTRIGQDELARPHYLNLIEAEPRNTGAMINLGTYHFHRREYVKAIERFRAVAAVEPDSLAAYYDLSQSYRALLEFSNADDFLAQARQLDANQVNEWIIGSTTAVSSTAGFERRHEIRRELLASWRGGSTGSFSRELVSQARSAPFTFLALVVAFAVHLVRGGGTAKPTPTKTTPTLTQRWTQTLVPGLRSVQEGMGLHAFAALLVPAGAITLPLSGALGYRIPWGYDPGNALAWTLAAIALALFYGVRLRRHLSS